MLSGTWLDPRRQTLSYAGRESRPSLSFSCNSNQRPVAVFFLLLFTWPRLNQLSPAVWRLFVLSSTQNRPTTTKRFEKACVTFPVRWYDYGSCDLLECRSPPCDFCLWTFSEPLIDVHGSS
ncbi:hypothetical protein FIBSPDRAFT_449200 [Athelia psychrophila]|uniref:Uncharacterized protein n=1 Tax=Athelia psychrophila TaxID=1759441 RepID=A0A167UE28_9AGAM|nr:hypothetical protein FIBSPDRAFT_449200 [Fibularhizoctonia sp. CBS 109695]